MKQENLMEEKKEAVLKLVDLGIDAKKAQKIIDTMLSNNQGVSNDVMAEDVVAVVKNDEIKDKRGTRIIGREKKQSTSNPLDIRTVVEQGKKDNKSAYEAIKESGYIISFEDDIFSKEVVS
jgi:Holliday junction resolvasome RuvABC DNA-binding subunit